MWACYIFDPPNQTYLFESSCQALDEAVRVWVVVDVCLNVWWPTQEHQVEFGLEVSVVQWACLNQIPSVFGLIE